MSLFLRFCILLPEVSKGYCLSFWSENNSGDALGLCKKFTYLFLCDGCFLMSFCLCTMSMPAAEGDQKRLLDPMEWEIQTILSYHVGVGN